MNERPPRLVNVHEAKTHLSKLLGEVERGRSITIARAGRPVAKLVPAGNLPNRTLGQEAGTIWIGDDFNDPMPEAWLDEWER